MKVLLGVDESEFSDAAVRYVAEAGWPKATKVSVVSACPPVILGAGEAVSGDAIAELMRQQEQFHREMAERAAARLQKAGLNATPRAAVGDPRSVLVDAAQAEHADLVVVGSHGRAGLKKLLLGSVASYVVTHAPCSVLVVRRGEAFHG